MGDSGPTQMEKAQQMVMLRNAQRAALSSNQNDPLSPDAIARQQRAAQRMRDGLNSNYGTSARGLEMPPAPSAGAGSGGPKPAGGGDVIGAGGDTPPGYSDQSGSGLGDTPGGKGAPRGPGSARVSPEDPDVILPPPRPRNRNGAGL